MQTFRIRLGALGLLLVVAACAATAGPSDGPSRAPMNLAGTTWRLLAIGGRPPPAGSEVTVAFDPGRVSGNSGCNSFGGAYTFDPGTGALSIGGLGSTKRACVEPALNDLETAFLGALGGATSAILEPAGRLVMSSGRGEIVLGPVP